MLQETYQDLWFTEEAVLILHKLQFTLETFKYSRLLEIQWELQSAPLEF